LDFIFPPVLCEQLQSELRTCFCRAKHQPSSSKFIYVIFNHLASQGLSNPGIATCVPIIHSTKQRMWRVNHDNPTGAGPKEHPKRFRECGAWSFYWFRLASVFLTQEAHVLCRALLEKESSFQD